MVCHLWYAAVAGGSGQRAALRQSGRLGRAAGGLAASTVTGARLAAWRAAGEASGNARGVGVDWIA
jgi:hypothetical protein